ncbi:MAG: hypothetical protein JJ913_02200 [Rhizobiaceae bacterium]|nr:hypothetical protein [Rhizobiaceae bacterium]
MGHVRLGRLPATRKWNEVVALLGERAPVGDIAGASANAAEASLSAARDDPALLHAFWLLTQLPLAARSGDFERALADLGLDVPANPGLSDLAGAVAESVDRQALLAGGRTDLGELAQSAVVQSLASVVGRELPQLFGSTAEDVRSALGRFAGKDSFGRLARDFLATLTLKHLDYYLSRAMPDFVGTASRFDDVADPTRFNEALELHCREASRIVEDFAGTWFSKTQYETGITPEKARGFALVALRKIGAELKARRGTNG